jgi:hypothetical protein
MIELPILDPAVVGELKRLIDNIKNDRDIYGSMDQIAGMVVECKLSDKKAYKPILQSVCALIREKGFPDTAAFAEKNWRL